MLKPEEGKLVLMIIKKCQMLRFENEIYQLTDNKGNYFVMPLVILPFGKGEDYYFNIVGDHLGQGYHQYKYANEYHPE